jgi:F0F1-type ATP synthase assembly protein I
MVFWVTRFYMFMIFGLIGFMVLHNVLDFRRKVQHKKRAISEKKSSSDKKTQDQKKK